VEDIRIRRHVEIGNRLVDTNNIQWRVGLIGPIIFQPTNPYILVIYRHSAKDTARTSPNKNSTIFLPFY
jgi:hypothetical protein